MGHVAAPEQVPRPRTSERMWQEFGRPRTGSPSKPPPLRGRINCRNQRRSEPIEQTRRFTSYRKADAGNPPPPQPRQVASSPGPPPSPGGSDDFGLTTPRPEERRKESRFTEDPEGSRRTPRLFQPIKIITYKGTKKDEGFGAHRFIKRMETYLRNTPGLTQGQMGLTLFHNLGEVQQGKDEAVGTLAQRLRDLFVQADISNEQVKIHHFKMSLRSPLREQLHTRGAPTFEEAVDIAEELDRGLWAMEKAPVTKAAPLRITARAANQVRVAEADRVSEADSERPQDDKMETARYTQQEQPRQLAAGRYPDRNGGVRGERPPQSNRPNFPPTKPQTCFNCLKTGHVQRDCPEPQKNTARWANGEEVEYGYDDCDAETVYED
ncbi:hypothetical protein KFL_002550030 [Klebsormidium nitens]|uniref:CCHC-type domain-containing protein n=1 Tax=Klebsormidium nitens TaxID=105231 RepID=A0A1Y1IAS8_KLENI|nr:hypothetical protein KFL_002550030 [Klebsormidium nitens]|eukprot:GAQ85796.1 hypothetical protein KFL_002550030 [Klebsormidium nitens]